MKSVFLLAVKSLWHRRVATVLTVISISLSVALFVGVDKIRDATEDAFSGAVSQVDLIVGPRTSPMSLLLYSVFHVGTPSHNVRMKSVDFARSMNGVEWVVPFSLGDGYSGFAVVGTTPDFFSRYKYRRGSAIGFTAGKPFEGAFEAVIGSEVAQKRALRMGDKMVLSHGHTEDGDGFEKHDDHPFTVVGVLAPTGTPLDKSVFTSLEGLGELHREVGGVAREEQDHDHEHEHDEHHDHAGAESSASFAEKGGKISVTAVSGFFLGAKNRMDALNLQRQLNLYEGDALLAILPGMAMAELWRNLSVFATALAVISFLVVVAGVLGLFVSLFIISEHRCREMIVLRAVGAGPGAIFFLLAGEAVCLVASGIILGSGVMYGLLALVGSWIERRLSVSLFVSGITAQDMMFAGALLVVGCVVGVIASVNAYRRAMHDGLGTRF